MFTHIAYAAVYIYYLISSFKNKNKEKKSTGKGLWKTIVPKLVHVVEKVVEEKIEEINNRGTIENLLLTSQTTALWMNVVNVLFDQYMAYFLICTKTSVEVG